MKYIIKLLFLLCAILILDACTTQKRKDDPSALGKAYHNMTARYNGYFNANVLYNESIAKLNDQHQDNYNKLLDVYEYMVADNPQAVAGDLDKAIEKVTVVVEDDGEVARCRFGRKGCDSAFVKPRVASTDRSLSRLRHAHGRTFFADGRNRVKSIMVNHCHVT